MRETSGDGQTKPLRLVRDRRGCASVPSICALTCGQIAGLFSKDDDESPSRCFPVWTTLSSGEFFLRMQADGCNVCLVVKCSKEDIGQRRAVALTIIECSAQGRAFELQAAVTVDTLNGWSMYSVPPGELLFDPWMQVVVPRLANILAHAAGIWPYSRDMANDTSPQHRLLQS
jgi:hypothetical protein